MDVSIIIPTYNRLWSLPKAIESCRNTKCNTEIIVIDDGSTDTTREWLESQRDIIKIFQINWGKCWAANKGFQIAKGKYVKFLDSDDMLSLNSIDEQYILAENQQADIVVSGFKVIDSGDNVMHSQDWIECDDFIAQQLGECDSSHYSAYLFKRDFIRDIPHRPDFAFRDDRLFVLEAAIKNPRVAVHKGTALLHRKHDEERLQFNNGLQGVVQNYQHIRIYRKMLALLKQKGELTDRRIEASLNVLWPLTHWIAKNNISEGVATYNWLKELKPNFTPPEAGALGLLYKTLGFKNTEKLLKFRRSIKNGW